MADTTTYWELLPEYGTAPKYLEGPDGNPIENPQSGELEPLAHAPTFEIHVPTKSGEQFQMKAKSVKTRLVDGHPRVLSTDDPLLVGPIVQTGLFRQIDSPKSAKPKES